MNYNTFHDKKRHIFDFSLKISKKVGKIKELCRKPFGGEFAPETPRSVVADKIIEIEQRDIPDAEKAKTMARLEAV